jgi:hypothetical protein
MKIGAKGIENMLVIMVLKENKKIMKFLNLNQLPLLPLPFKCIGVPTKCNEVRKDLEKDARIK